MAMALQIASGTAKVQRCPSSFRGSGGTQKLFHFKDNAAGVGVVSTSQAALDAHVQLAS